MLYRYFSCFSKLWWCCPYCTIAEIGSVKAVRQPGFWLRKKKASFQSSYLLMPRYMPRFNRLIPPNFFLGARVTSHKKAHELSQSFFCGKISGGKKGLNLPVEIEIKTQLDSTNKHDAPIKVGGIEVMGSLVSNVGRRQMVVETCRKMTIRSDFLARFSVKCREMNLFDFIFVVFEHVHDDFYVLLLWKMALKNLSHT